MFRSVLHLRDVSKGAQGRRGGTCFDLVGNATRLGFMWILKVKNCGADDVCADNVFTIRFE